MNWHIVGFIVLFAGILAIIKQIKKLPDQIAEKMIEKLREEEKRRQEEQNKR